MTINRATYREWVLGTLVYVVVLSIFNDYTDLIYIKSASVIIAVSLVLQGLTYWTLVFKKWVSSKFNYSKAKKIKPAKFFSLWAILFFSKFIYLWIIDWVFGKNVEISGFISLMLIIVVMIAVKESLKRFDQKLK